MFKTVEVILSAKIKLYAKIFFKLETEEEEGGGGDFLKGNFPQSKCFAFAQSNVRLLAWRIELDDLSS